MSIKLLIIDDDPYITDMLDLVLPTKGFEVFSINTGEDGVKATHKIDPDVVVLDLMMPGIDGWSLCQQIRSFSQVPILILSAVIESPSIARAMEKGANDYLTKPVPLNTLVTRIKELAQ
ncbi:MAG: response regulator transcription factor [Anaerolineae bacterium]|nr:response regulator transcription factor [Anaerolineae bacterium]